MNYQTVEVELENGQVRPSGSETLPAKARALLTPLDNNAPGPALTCRDLAKSWTALDKLVPTEAAEFANDIEQGCGSFLQDTRRDSLHAFPS